MGLFSKIKDSFAGETIKDEEHEDEYVELDTQSHDDIQSKIVIRTYTIEDFSDIKNILDALRAGNTVALINIKPLKEKDLVELKRAVNKLKKTTDAIEGDIAGFGDDWLVAAPSFAKIHRSNELAAVDAE
ncbi:MAG: cell division protein SepF [DPANN group archaeon]|nr:cell division protein SepF [DPANN group archaeon]